MQVTFNWITFRNFMSFGNNETYVDLSNPQAYEIVGENLDKPESRNGTGKTTLFNAICYALFNTPFSKIKLGNLINLTNAQSKVSMETTINYSVDGVEYEIYRSRGAVNAIKVLKDGVDITPGKSIAEADQIVSESLKMSFDVFGKTVLFSGDAKPFLDLSAADQRAFIEELFNIGLLSEKAVLLKDKIKTTEADIKVQQAVIKQQETAEALHQKQLKDAKTRITKWETDTANEIQNIKTKLALSQTDVNIPEQQSIQNEYNQLQPVILGLKKDLSATDAKLADLEKMLSKKDAEIASLESAKCPYCSQAMHDAQEKIQEVVAECETLISSLEKLDATKLVIETDLTNASNRANELKSKLVPNLSSIIDAKMIEDGLKVKLAGLEEAVNPHTENYEELQKIQMTIDYSLLNDLERRLTHQQFLLKLLTHKDSFIRKNIINTQLPILNDRIKYYGKLMGLPHQLQFNADMTCEVTEFGREIDFGNLSKGETKRANIALNFAFRDVVSLNKNRTNLLLVDELDGGLDDSGLECFLRIVKNKCREEQMTAFVISHHPVIRGRLDKQMLIQKQHGFSRIVE